MTGLANYSADNLLNYLTGSVPMPALPAAWMALFTAVGTDAGSGFTEVSGNGYARVQVGGSAVTNATTASGNNTLHFASTPAWLVAGMQIFDVTTPASIPTNTTILSTTGTTVVMSANAAGAGVGSGDTISFSAFSPQATGTGPASIQNGSIITMPQATGAGWGTVIAFALYDASTTGNLQIWDFLGGFSWLPFEIPTASNLATVKGNGMSSNDPIVFTNEYGGTLPTLSTGTMTGFTVNFVATPATDTINIDTTTGPATPIVTTSSGSGMVRKIVQQSIPAGVTASFAAAALVATAA